MGEQGWSLSSSIMDHVTWLMSHFKNRQ
jgi:hypothetical protein